MNLREQLKELRKQLEELDDRVDALKKKIDDYAKRSMKEVSPQVLEQIRAHAEQH